MKVSLSWLSQYVSVDRDIHRLADSLTMVGLEVDAVWDRFDDLARVFVGRIEAVRPHPNAEKLRICDVALADRQVSVVCGAPNAVVGMHSPLALPGTRLADGTILEESTIRGVASEGMLCSEAELGLGTDRSGLMVLSSDTAAGDRLVDALALSDPVMEIELTPNRPDCLSILGVAREVAAICQTQVRYPEVKMPEATGRIEEYTSVTIEDPDRCPRYAAALVFDVTVGPSPPWLQERLLSVGLRPINNIVDITNFVMMETGQPLHAFDFERLAENRIVVRTAENGEPFTTLDGKQRELTDEMLMICDGRKPVAVGGVMGGENSEIFDETTAVLIESAYFNPPSIRRTARKLGLGTDASHRFERGVDPEGTLTALRRAAALVADLGGGRLVKGEIDAHPKPSQTPIVSLTAEAANRLLGTDFSASRIAALLESIEFSVTSDDDETLSVTPPSFRVDVSRPEDLIEEVARLSGYNQIPETSPQIPAEKPPRTDLRDFRDRIRSLMTGFGFTETVNYSFASARAADQLLLAEDDPRRNTVKLLNPLTDEQSVMRTTLAAGLLETVQRNLSRQILDLKLFEIGKVFFDTGYGQLPDEFEMLGGIWTGARRPVSWHGAASACDFFDLKGIVEGLADGLALAGARFTQLEDARCDYVRPGHSAWISFAGEQIGFIGEIRRRVLKNMDIDQPCFYFEVDVEQLRKQVPAAVSATPIPRYPAVTRDITLIVDRALASSQVLDCVQDVKEPLLERVHLFDVFDGKPIPKGKKSISFRITYRSHEQTLEDEAVNRVHEQITEKLLHAFDAALPG